MRLLTGNKKLGDEEGFGGASWLCALAQSDRQLLPIEAVTLEKGGCVFNRTCALNRTNTVSLNFHIVPKNHRTMI